jgi:hypothetical protein
METFARLLCQTLTIRSCYSHWSRTKNPRSLQNMAVGEANGKFKPFLQFASTNTNVANVPGGYETIPLQSEGEEVLRSDNAGADTVSQNEDDLFHGGPLSPNASIITNAPVTSTQTVVTQTTNTSDTARTKTPVTPRTNTSQRNSTTRKRRLEEQTQTPTSIDKVIAYFDKKPCNNTQAAYDDVDLIFLSYAKTLKKFSPRRQTMTKFKIAQLLMEEELNQQAEDGYTTTTVSVHPGPSSTETSAMDYKLSCLRIRLYSNDILVQRHQ